jgi:hypothetical protein
MKKLTIICMIFLSLSCTKKETVTSSKNDPIDLFMYFPLEIGNSWCYESVSTAEQAVVERTVADTIRHEDGRLFFKAKWGIKDYPDDEYFSEYYYWSDSGLYIYYCGIEDECMEGQIGYRLIIKSPSYESEIWNRNADWWQPQEAQTNIIDSLIVHYSHGSTIFDTTFFNVALLNYKYGEGDASNSYEYYAPDFGLVEKYSITENDTTYHLKILECNLIRK